MFRLLISIVKEYDRNAQLQHHKSDQNIHMLPGEVSERFSSLAPAEWRGDELLLYDAMLSREQYD